MASLRATTISYSHKKIEFVNDNEIKPKSKETKLHLTRFKGIDETKNKKKQNFRMFFFRFVQFSFCYFDVITGRDTLPGESSRNSTFYTSKADFVLRLNQNLLLQSNSR
jgi:hypothetical protein